MMYMRTGLNYNIVLCVQHIPAICAYNIPPLLVQQHQLMSAKKRWGGRLVRLEHLSSISSLALGGSLLGGGSTIGVFDTEIEKSSSVSDVVDD